MAQIAVLDQSTIDKIAAGEVVERPASVVKELLENAIDAKASAVTVEIKDGGTSLIRVTDNGCGITKDEIRLAFCRHATSKIQKAEDLMSVSSLGFRGEALSSIAAVSQVEFITKTADSLTGVRYRIEGGVEKDLEEIGAPEGTTFLVRNLFFNTPVRKKFLKSNTTEGAYVADMVQKIAMSHPEVSIRLIQNNQNKIHTSGNHNLKDMIYALYGREIAANLLPVDYSAHPQIHVKGFAGKPVIARGNRNLENYYINGRYIKSSLIFKAIEDAYKPYMMQHMYPFAVLQIMADPAFLDVNVHPTKMEVRFGNGELVYQSVYDAISQALAGKELIPNVKLSDSGKESKHDDGETLNKDFQASDGAKKEPQQDDRLLQKTRMPEPFEVNRREKDAEEKASVWKKENNLTSKHSLVKDADETYGSSDRNREMTAGRILAESDRNQELHGGKTLEDMFRNISDHKVRLENAAVSTDTAKSISSDLVSGSSQVDSVTITDAVQQNLFEEGLLTKEARSRHRLIGQLFDTYWLIEYNEQLYIIDQHAAHEKVLYERTMKSLKTREYTSQQISPPIILTLTPQEQVLFEANKKEFEQIGFEIEPFGDTEYAVYAVPDNLFSIAKKELLLEMIGGLSQDLVLERVASMSCKAAVKGNHKMSPMEADKLIDELLTLDNPYACPHGRPTIIAMSKYELEKKFKRIV